MESLLKTQLWERSASFPDLIWAQKVLKGRDPAVLSLPPTYSHPINVC